MNQSPDLLRKYSTKFRCHRLLIEAGARSQVLRDMRMCQFCETDICDEFHYLLCCPNFKEERKNFLIQNITKDLQPFTYMNSFIKLRVKTLKNWLCLSN